MTVSHRVLIIAPLHDVATKLSNNAVNRLVNWIDQENIKRINKDMPFIEYKIVNGFLTHRIILWLLKHNGYNLICYYGHGLKDRLGDLWIYVLPLIDKHNIHWYRNTIMYTMACHSAEELGKVAIERGVKAYFGQTGKYFGFLPTLHYKYWSDWYDLVNIIPKALLSGATAGAALNMYEAFANQLYAKFLAKPIRENTKLLFSNALNLQLYGDRTAKVLNKT